MSSAEGVDDLTRKQRREQARSQRRAIEEAQAAQAARRRRLIQLGGALGVAIIVVIAAIALSSSGSSSKKPAPPTPQTTNAVTALLAGIPQSGNTLGNPKAPVTMQYYGDLECPVCQSFELNTLPQIISSDVRSNKLQVQYLSLETATADRTTFQNQQVAALAASKQNKMWNYVDLFYRRQGAEGSGYVNDAFLQGLAKQVPGLNLVSWQSARGDSTLAQLLASDAQAAAQNGFNATPTLVVRGPHGAKAVSGNVPYSTIAQMIKGVS